jgi:glycosyltransferase involved in cell wall biosynthesis
MNAKARGKVAPVFLTDRLRQPVELTIVIPTFNERENVEPLIGRLSAALRNISWEAIFVDDDSPDGTANLLREIAHKDPQVRVIHRIARRGLASACVEGVLSSSAPCFAFSMLTCNTTRPSCPGCSSS